MAQDAEGVGLATPISATGRLLRILRDAVARDRNKPFLETWAQVFGVDPANRTRVYQLLGDFFGLVEVAKVEIKAHPELKQELYLGTVEGIERILLDANHQAPWNQVASQLDGSNLRALEFCGDQLDRLSSEREVPQEFLQGLQAEIEALISQIPGSTLELDLQSALVAKLEEVRSAILVYRLRGVDGIRVATQAAVGALVMAYPKVAGKSGRLKIVQDVLDVLVKLATLAEKANLLMPGSGIAIKALLSGGGTG